MTGAALIVKVFAAETVVSGFTTVTCAELPVIIPELIEQVRLVTGLPTAAVVWFTPFQAMCAPDTNPLPCTVSVKPGLPMVA